LVEIKVAEVRPTDGTERIRLPEKGSLKMKAAEVRPTDPGSFAL
jgi:hypothetical protein